MTSDDAAAAARILHCLRERGSLKASEIADALGVERREVNRMLYGLLVGRVHQDNKYRWSASDGHGRPVVPATEAAARGFVSCLSEYYLDCLAQDAEQGCSVFAANQFGDLDYAVLTDLPSLSAGGRWSAPLSDDVQKLSRKGKADRTAALYVGYPVLLRFHRTSRWQGYFLEPVLLYELRANESNVLEIVSDVPSLNFRAIRSVGDGGSVLSDVIAISEDLGLDSAAERPALEDIALRLHGQRPHWPWQDRPVLTDRRVDPPISTLTTAGIYNYAVLIAGDRPTFTLGLETELRALQRLDDHAVRDTALGSWLSTEAGPSETPSSEALVEVVGLNSEQRNAVASGLTHPLTVITGPPGTGKSQVVTALLANAAWRGQKVLFASKNNKAVDVVEHRVNGLSSRPSLIRLGSRQYESRLADFLVSLLAGVPEAEDQIAYDHALARQTQFTDTAKRLESDRSEVIHLRNAIDESESNLESWRSVFGPSFEHLSAVVPAHINREVARLTNATNRADRRRVGLLASLLWFVLRSSRFEALRQVATDSVVRRALQTLAVQLSESPSADAGIPAFSALVDDVAARANALASIVSYLTDLGRLKATRSLEDLSREQSEMELQLAENSLALWQAWTRLQPARLARADRQALTTYNALLQIVLDSTRAGAQIPAQTWHQYRSLVPKISHLIPCWAVTSLSAHGKIPLEPGLFDLLVIDEASQCDIASALPLLFRAKRVAVIGDPMQLQHISKVVPRQDAQLQEKHRLPRELKHWTYSVTSLYQLANALAPPNALIRLRDHHRSHADIIEFSNQHFYDGRLRIATRYDGLKRGASKGPAVQWVNVAGSASRPASGSVINEREASSVIHLLRRVAIDQRYEGTVGVVSPFRAQATRIQEMVGADAELRDRLDQLEFLSETAHQFQGDERDLMIFSPVVAAGIGEGALNFLRRNGNLFNVAITRARGALYVVGDKAAAANSGVDYLAEFARYADGLLAGVRRQEEVAQRGSGGADYPAVARPELVSDWEKVLYKALHEAGLRPLPQFPVEQYLLDLAIIENGHRLDVEVDGERYHRAWDGELVRRDRLRNQRLLELGWDVKRFWVYQVRDDLSACVKDILDWTRRSRGGDQPSAI